MLKIYVSCDTEVGVCLVQFPVLVIQEMMLVLLLSSCDAEDDLGLV